MCVSAHGEKLWNSVDNYSKAGQIWWLLREKWDTQLSLQFLYLNGFCFLKSASLVCFCELQKKKKANEGAVPKIGGLGSHWKTLDSRYKHNSIKQQCNYAISTHIICMKSHKKQRPDALSCLRRDICRRSATLRADLKIVRWLSQRELQGIAGKLCSGACTSCPWAWFMSGGQSSRSAYIRFSVCCS